MALIICPECGGKISDKAKSCIHCGFPMDENTKSLAKLKEKDTLKSKRNSCNMSKINNNVDEQTAKKIVKGSKENQI